RCRSARGTSRAGRSRPGSTSWWCAPATTARSRASPSCVEASAAPHPARRRLPAAGEQGVEERVISTLDACSRAPLCYTFCRVRSGGSAASCTTSPREATPSVSGPQVRGWAAGREAGKPVKQQHIGFRELLERLLPLEELPSVDRLRVQRALRSGIAVEVERAALRAIDLLEQQGAI